MSVAVLYVDERGLPSIDANAIMQGTLELVGKNVDSTPMDLKSFLDIIESTHASLLRVAGKLLEHEKSNTPTPRPVRLVEVAPVETPASTVSSTLEAPPIRPTELLLAPVAEPTPAPVAEVLPAERVLPSDTIPKRRRTDRPAKELRIPRRLSTIDEAIREDKIICLEDGKSVIDLGKHLADLGMGEAEYRKKWKLSGDYPMKAPSFVQKRGIEYEYDPIHNRMIRT